MKTNYNYKNLGCGIAYQAVKDFCDPYTSKAMKKKILKDLRSEHLIQLSDGLSLVVAEQLENNPKVIAERLGREDAV